jgi:hypothetical protein
VLILFDQGTPVPLRHELKHSVETAFERQWSALANGDLLTQAEQEGFEVLVTTDGNLRYQQDLSSRRIAIVVLKTPSWPRIKQSLAEVISAIDQAVPGSYTEVEIP